MVLHRALYGAVQVPNRIDGYYRQCGDGLNPLALAGVPPDQIWREALGNLTVAGKLQRLCEVLLNDQSLAGIHDAVRAVIGGGMPQPAPIVVPNGRVNGNVPDIVNQSRPYLEAAEFQLNGTADKKELHKWLHRLQDEFYLRLPTLQEQFPDSIPELKRHLKTVQRDMASFHQLATCPALDSLDVQGIEVDLNGILKSIQAATDSKVKGSLLEGVSMLDTMLGLRMPEIDGALREAANNLRLDELANRLQQIAQQYPEAGVNSNDVNLTLSLNQSTRTGVANHRVWQRIDSQVRLFLQGFSRPLDELTINWSLLKRLIEERVALEPKSEWAAQLAESIQDFDQELQANDSSGFRNTFIDIREVTREQFSHADEQLLADFSALRLIATRIAALLK